MIFNVYSNNANNIKAKKKQKITKFNEFCLNREILLKTNKQTKSKENLPSKTHKFLKNNNKKKNDKNL